ncbi:MAG: PhoU domain-containing protein, partial [Pseudomonadota bacterium]
FLNGGGGGFRGKCLFFSPGTTQGSGTPGNSEAGRWWCQTCQRIDPICHSPIEISLQRVPQDIKLSELPPSASNATEIRQIGRHVGTMLRDVLDSFARLDVRKAVEVVIDDYAVDTEYDSAMRSLVALMMEDARNISGVLHEMWALRGLERVGDHATNIAEQVVYLVRGEDVRHMKPAELQDLLRAEENA